MFFLNVVTLVNHPGIFETDLWRIYTSCGNLKNIFMTYIYVINGWKGYSKISGSLWQFYKDEPNDNLADSESFKSKVNITKRTPNNVNTKVVEIIAPLNYLSNF